MCKTYLLEIIPLPCYKVNMMSEEALIKDVPDLVVQRRSDVPDDLAFEDGEPDISKITSLAFRNIAEMSVNIMGGKFKKEDAYWMQKGEAHKSWNGTEEINPTLFEALCEPSDQVTLFYFRAKSLHGLRFPHPRRLNKEGERKLYKIVNQVCDELMSDNTKIVIVEGRLKFTHVPTKMNYWHGQIELSTIMANEIESKFPSKRYDDIRRGFVEALKNRANLEIDIPIIPPSAYIKT